jgi:DNA-binding transcriptional LysR family regulator
LSPESLSKEPFVHFPREISPILYDQIAEICRNAGFIPNVTQETRAWLTSISLVEAGLGVAIVPNSVGRLKLGGVSFVPLDSPTESTIALCYRRENVPPPITVFVQIAREYTVK